MPETAGMARLLNLVNDARAEPRSCGGKRFGAAPALRWNDALSVPAARHALDMERGGFFSHIGSDGSDVGERLSRARYLWSRAGENLAYGTPSAYSEDDIVAGWLASPGHCKNIMQPGFTEMGAAKHSGAFDYWVQVFATPAP